MMFLHEKWLNLVFHNKSSFDRMIIKPHFFLEKRAIFLIFHCKYKSSTCPNSSPAPTTEPNTPDRIIKVKSHWRFLKIKVKAFLYNQGIGLL
ncbi:hypothetical protein B5J93_07250 [Moraxella equi]|uniref:Uncharacterized protein n=1 Tax=Moraxella equi TaxID=60442 RepID=A0ABX3NHN2_9GAMM|nr:hypothetical protein B5J93_07250 [Moraxella equi]